MVNIRDLIKQIKASDSKSKKLIINSNLSLIVKGSSLFVSLFTMPAYMRIFKEQEVLGLWFTTLSVLSWILTFDLGIGNGLRNHLVKPLMENNRVEIKKYISSAYIMVGFVVIFFSVLGYKLIPYLNFNIVFNINKAIVPNHVLIYIVRWIFIGIMLQFLLKLVSSIYFAIQKPAVPSFLTLLSSILLLVFVLLQNPGTTIKNLKTLASLYIISSNLPLLGATVYIFVTKLKDCVPSFKYFSFKYSGKVLKLGSIFFWLQIMTMLIFSTNEFLITWFVGPSKVVDYQIYNKLFGLISTFFNIGLTPVWSAITEAAVNKDYLWIKKLFDRLKKMVYLAIVGEVILIFSLQILVNLWLGTKAITVSKTYGIIFALSGIVYIWITLNANIAAGIERLKIPFIFLSLGALLNVPLAYLFTLKTNSWISIMLANIISMMPYSIIQPIVLDKWLRLKIRGQINEDVL